MTPEEKAKEISKIYHDYEIERNRVMNHPIATQIEKDAKLRVVFQDMDKKRKEIIQKR